MLSGHWSSLDHPLREGLGVGPWGRASTVSFQIKTLRREVGTYLDQDFLMLTDWPRGVQIAWPRCRSLRWTMVLIFKPMLLNMQSHVWAWYTADGFSPTAVKHLWPPPQLKRKKTMTPKIQHTFILCPKSNSIQVVDISILCGQSLILLPK